MRTQLAKSKPLAILVILFGILHACLYCRTRCFCHGNYNRKQLQPRDSPCLSFAYNQDNWGPDQLNNYVIAPARSLHIVEASLVALQI